MVFEESIALAAGGREQWDLFSSEDSSTYLITARLEDGTEESYEWNLNEKPEDGSVLIFLDGNGALHIEYSVP